MLIRLPPTSSTHHDFCLYLTLLPTGLNVLGYQSHLVQRRHPACGHQRSSHLSPVLTFDFLSRSKRSTITIRQPMVEFYLLTFSRFQLRKTEEKVLLLKRIELMTSVVVVMRGYPQDNSGDEGQTHQPPPPTSIILRSHFPFVSHLWSDCSWTTMHLIEGTYMFLVGILGENPCILPEYV